MLSFASSLPNTFFVRMLYLLLLFGFVAAAPGNKNSVPAPSGPFNVSQLAAPNEGDNILLNFKDKSLKVSRQLLSDYSTSFADSLAEHKKSTGSDKMESMKVDDDYDEFVTALQVLFPGGTAITDENVATILKIAGKWKIKKMMYLYLAENHLTNSNAFTTQQKLHLADDHRLPTLLEHCLQSYSTVLELTDALSEDLRINAFSPVATAAIMHRKMELVKDKRLWE
ncbi:hypothetical protein PRIPAC_79609 [Pristionchus pacificus]|uniref:BTB domain-containing protein n=1 Tax=Pristionchus pacificus TaxID=54126 RepID=A0A2A6BHL7_PRIPA|nr:hypothetical protein PRIPAC_79609 [Pristionchus pacificus]|eukprot:PDM65301.1 BTB domain-containing protein [Pristionchus pacificus]